MQRRPPELLVTMGAGRNQAQTPNPYLGAVHISCSDPSARIAGKLLAATCMVGSLPKGQSQKIKSPARTMTNIALFINVWLATIRLSESTGVNPNIDCKTPDCESRFEVLAVYMLGKRRKRQSGFAHRVLAPDPALRKVKATCERVPTTRFALSQDIQDRSCLPPRSWSGACHGQRSETLEW
jgi:hypothetical protein